MRSTVPCAKARSDVHLALKPCPYDDLTLVKVLCVMAPDVMKVRFDPISQLPFSISIDSRSILCVITYMIRATNEYKQAASSNRCTFRLLHSPGHRVPETQLDSAFDGDPSQSSTI